MKSQLAEPTVDSFAGVKWLDIIAYHWLVSWSDLSAPESQTFSLLALFHPFSFSCPPSFLPFSLGLTMTVKMGFSQHFNKQWHWVTQLLVSTAEPVDFVPNCCLPGPQAGEASVRELLLQFAMLNYKNGQETVGICPSLRTSTFHLFVCLALIRVEMPLLFSHFETIR